MPFLDSLDFAASNLAVAYRGGIDPQVLTVRVWTAGPAQVPFAEAAIATFIELVNLGAAGGAELPPIAGAARLLDGPVDPHAVDRTWMMQVAGVAPRFLRTLVESLRRAGDEHAVTAMAISGSLATERGPLSVREDELKLWLDSPTEYLGAWPEPPFRVIDREAATGARIRARLRDGASPEVLAAFEKAMMAWSLAILDYADRNHRERGTIDRDPRIGRTRNEISASFAVFTYDPTPAWASLLNVLAGFHARVAKIEGVELAVS